MKTLSEINIEIENLENLQKETKRSIQEIYRQKWKISEKTRIALINEDFISVDCVNFEDFKQIFKNCQPYETSHVIKYADKNIYIDSPFMFTICNNYYKRELKFEFKKINGLKIWVTIDFNLIPENIKNVYFVPTKRGLYDSETHYVNLPSQYKKFKDIRISAFNFCAPVLNWYGGDKTILSSPETTDFMNQLSNN